MGPVAVPNEPSMATKPHYKAKQASDSSHGQLGAVSHQCHFIKARHALSQSYQSSTGS